MKNVLGTFLRSSMTWYDRTKAIFYQTSREKADQELAFVAKYEKSIPALSSACSGTRRLV